jgi:hypothetical protein
LPAGLKCTECVDRMASNDSHSQKPQAKLVHDALQNA